MNVRRQTAVAWVATSLTCLYGMGSLIILHRQRSAVQLLIPTIAVELPLSTKLVIGFWPLFFCAVLAAGIFLVIKECAMKDKGRSLTVTLITAIVVLLGLAWIQNALLSPFISEIEKIGNR